MSIAPEIYIPLAGLDPAIHEFFVFPEQNLFVDARAKPAQGASRGMA